MKQFVILQSLFYGIKALRISTLKNYIRDIEHKIRLISIFREVIR